MVREIIQRQRDTPVALQATKDFWAMKRADARREAALSRQDNGDWLCA